MRLSVIIPALNERNKIEGAIASARQSEDCEIIVVDGGSSDGTREAAFAADVRVLKSTPSRGLQQNLGAWASKGDTLLFLHADTRLPSGYAETVERTLQRKDVVAGAFRFRLDAQSLGFAVLEKMVHLRNLLLQLPYGDQALFLRREVFERAGGFPDMPIMEDFALVRRLRRLGRVAIADSAATTSARRWRKLGLFRTTWSNQVCILAYLLDVKPERIARWRASL